MAVKNGKNLGFTLMEALVTIGIIVLISGVSFAGLTEYKKRTYFNDTVTQVHGAVLKAQNLAMFPTSEDIVQYTVIFENNKYKTEAAKKDGTVVIVDSGKISDKVKILDRNGVEGPVAFRFNVGGGMPEDGKGIIYDIATGKQSYVTADSAGSVELVP